MSETLNKSYVSVGEPLLPAGKMFFTIQPHNFTVTGPGQEVTFRGVAVGAFGYLWAWRADPSAEWAVIDGEVTDTFTTLVSAGMNGWQFICVALDADENYLESRIATITCTGLTEVSQEGAIVTIEHGPVELKSLIVNIEPVQEGTGDPSSENIRAISGFTECNLVDTPENKWTLLWDIDSSFNGEVAWNQIADTRSNDKVGPLNNYYYGFSALGVDLVPDHKYYTSVHIERTISDNDGLTVLAGGIAGGQYIVLGSVTDGEANGTKCRISTNAAFGSGLRKNIFVSNYGRKGHLDEGDEVHLSDIMVIDLTQMFGSTIADYIYTLESNTAGAGVAFFKNLYPDDYYPYDASTEELVGGDNKIVHTIPFEQTVYSGYLDVLTGKLYTCPYYASYDGETLTGHWISDRDVYAEGTTPTTGAQVVNDGGTLTEVELDPVDIATIMGQNNIYASTGNVSVTYLDWPADPEEIELNPQITPLNPLDTDPVLEPSIDDIQPIAYDLQPIEFDTLL